MVKSLVLKEKIKSGELDDLLLDIYVDEAVIDYQKNRYISAIEKYESLYGKDDEISIFSAPGRSEVGGNHTDHQQGEILAAGINLDAIAITKKLDTPVVKITSGSYREIEVDINDIEYKEAEKETTLALIKGVLAGAKNRGYEIGGFQCYITSDVLVGAGLSSSAAFEVLIGTIINYLYNDGKLDAITNAIISQYAENVYFGKPCGLMDQMACSVGSLVHVDFADKAKPVVNKVSFDMNKHGYSLCITDTKGSHADLTADYAAIPTEMKSVAACFGKNVLVGLTTKEVLENISEIRKKCGDRAVLRALHFINENERVKKEVKALDEENIPEFLENVKQSGNSSYKYLQNVYSNSDVAHQNVSIALCVSEMVLEGGKGVSRVHGGGFAGTIQAFVKNEFVDEYKTAMEQLFGDGCCHVLKIRKYGGMKVVE